jgi:type IV pilus assembly protein PilY1
MLICGQKEGGSGYTALDISNPEVNGFSVLWDIQIPLLKESWTVPCIVRDEHLDKFVMVVGSGPDSTTRQAHAVAVDLADGSTLWTNQLSTSTGMNMANAARTIDTDFDGYDDYVYVTDLSGHVWRYDMSTDPWTKQLLFETTQPIQTSPVLATDVMGRVVVAFGTGRYMIGSDISNASQQTFYCLFDDLSSTTIAKADLVNQTSSFHQLQNDDPGWYINLVQQSGERVTKTCSIAAGTVYFTSFKPQTALCQAGGTSWLYAADLFDGSAPDNEDLSENDTLDGRTEDLGSGIYNDPIIDLVNEQIVLQSTDTSLQMEDIHGNVQRVLVRSWRQLFQ